MLSMLVTFTVMLVPDSIGRLLLIGGRNRSDDVEAKAHVANANIMDSAIL